MDDLTGSQSRSKITKDTGTGFDLAKKKATIKNELTEKPQLKNKNTWSSYTGGCETRLAAFGFLKVFGPKWSARCAGCVDCCCGGCAFGRQKNCELNAAAVATLPDPMQLCETAASYQLVFVTHIRASRQSATRICTACARALIEHSVGLS